MSLRDVVLIAFRFLSGAPMRNGGKRTTRSDASHRRGRSRLITAVVGVALSLVPLVVVQQIADGMISGIVTRFIETGSYHIQGIARGGVEIDSIPQVVDELKSVPGVVTATQERQGFGLLYSDTTRSGVTIRAVGTGYWRDDPGVKRFIDETSGAMDLSAEDSIVVGTHIASNLGLEVGDSVRLLTVKPVGEGRMLPRVSRFTVSGIVSTGYRDLDRLWVFIPLDRGLRVIPDETAHDIIGIKTDYPFSIPNPLFRRGLSRLSSQDEIADTYKTIGGITGTIGSEWHVADWYSLEQGRYVSFLTSRNLLSVVMAMIVIVAAINVSSTLVLLALEKEEEIAIMRATGIDSASIGRVFIAAALIVGIVGATIGSVVGVTISNHINDVLRGIEWLVSVIAGRPVDVFSSDFYLEEIPVTLRFLPVAFSIFFALLVAFVAGLLPARRASAIQPIRILRHSA